MEKKGRLCVREEIPQGEVEEFDPVPRPGDISSTAQIETAAGQCHF